MDFYDLSSKITGLQQGDLLSGVPFTTLDITAAFVELAPLQGEETIPSATTERDLTADNSRVEVVRVPITFGWGVILTQTCDIQPLNSKLTKARKPIVIARARPADEVLQNFKGADTPEKSVSLIKSVFKPNEKPPLFYLPDHESENVSFKRSIVTLLEVQTFIPENLVALIRLRKLRMSKQALGSFQVRCGYCFGRFAETDHLPFNEKEWEIEEESQRDKERKRLENLNLLLKQ